MFSIIEHSGKGKTIKMMQLSLAGRGVSRVGKKGRKGREQIRDRVSIYKDMKIVHVV